MEETRQYLTSFQRRLLQKSLQEDLPKSYRQRLQIMLLADEGKSQTEICQILGCCPATVRHWMHIARTGMAHQWQDCPIGRPKIVNDDYLERLKELLSHSPRDYGYSFRRWTVNWLAKQLAKEFGVELSDRSIKRLLKQMGLSTRPKATHANQIIDENEKSCKILIRDLESSDLQDGDEFSPIPLALFETDSDIHGAASIRTVGVSATARAHVGTFSFRESVPALS